MSTSAPTTVAPPQRRHSPPASPRAGSDNRQNPAGKSTSEFKIGLLGHGTVGAAFSGLLQDRSEEIKRLTGYKPVISDVLTRTRGDFQSILDNSDIVVELIGGIDPAREYITQALKARKPVVTANKQLLPQHGEALWGIARHNKVQLRFEAAVAGVIPIISVLKESLAAAPLDRLHGIVNGTTNYILTQMDKHGASYEEALAEAQELGYAEADPSEDVSGKDAAAKMVILTRLAFGSVIKLDDVIYEGIEGITSDDLEAARGAGLKIKLVSTVERTHDGISARAHPTLLYPSHPLASVDGSFNAITIESPAITRITMEGPGAGGTQTASAVLSDVISVMAHKEPTALDNPLQADKNKVAVTTDFESAFFLYMKVLDQPGVLAVVAEILGRHEISIKDAFVRELLHRDGSASRGQEKIANMTLVLHKVSQSRFDAAFKEIGDLDLLRSRPRRMRALEVDFA